MDDQSRAPRQVTSCIRHRVSDAGGASVGANVVSKRDLNQHTASVLDRVTDGDDVVVTEGGKPRWRISSFRPDAPLIHN
jgi:prevent-host-death family protein